MRIQSWLLLLLLAASCKTGTNDTHLSAGEMGKVLLDVHLAEAYGGFVKDSLHRPGVKNMDSLAQYYKDIFAHHHISQAQFDKSMSWYKAHPDELDSIYSNLIPELTKTDAMSAVKK